MVHQWEHSTGCRAVRIQLENPLLLDPPEVRDGSGLFCRPRSVGIEGPKMSRSRIPTRNGGIFLSRRNAKANARFTVGVTRSGLEDMTWLEM
jgi:hypothetical protein